MSNHGLIGKEVELDLINNWQGWWLDPDGNFYNPHPEMHMQWLESHFEDVTGAPVHHWGRLGWVRVSIGIQECSLNFKFTNRAPINTAALKRLLKVFPIKMAMVDVDNEPPRVQDWFQTFNTAGLIKLFNTCERGTPEHFKIREF